MSTLANRRELPSTWRFPVQRNAFWRDFAAALIFGAFGLSITALALINNIPLVGDGIWSG